jgi:hypothetical protein
MNDWSWQRITFAMMWKLSPRGLVLVRRDLKLPQDRVLLEERQMDYIKLSFITLKEARARTHTSVAEQRATSDTLTGRWKQIACVMLWKLSKAGVWLGQADHDAVPLGFELLTAGHPDGVEWNFVPKIQARMIEKSFFENEGKTIMEKA